MTINHVYLSISMGKRAGGNFNQKTNCSNIYRYMYRYIDRYIFIYLYVSTKYSQPFKKDQDQFQNLASETMYLNKQDNELRRPQTH